MIGRHAFGIFVLGSTLLAAACPSPVAASPPESGGGLAASVGPHWSGDEVTRVYFHEEFYEGVASLPTPATDMRSNRSAGGSTSFDDRDSVLRHVLMKAPDPATVFPTERYYYFEFYLAETLVKGNLRFAEWEDGIIHFAYYDAHDKGRIVSHAYKDQVDIRVEPIGVDACEVTHRGISASFRMAARPEMAVSLLAGEEVVSTIRDDSGISLILLYNNKLHTFYYCVEREHLKGDVFFPRRVDGAGRVMLVGRYSRFVFLRTTRDDRLLLIGVYRPEVRDNSHFDGPFDQVPSDLHIREKLHAAYPYVKRRGGIDDHGRFRERKNARVAIAAYQKYLTLRGLSRYVADAMESTPDGPDLWARLAYEPKRRFHEVLDRNDDGAPRIWKRQDWPANHSLNASASWPGDHSATASDHWPADHRGEHSGEFDPRVRSFAPWER